jgi:lipopolysaccharide/colanic/teichoic acid biosynthesis glycosyltransferase
MLENLLDFKESSVFKNIFYPRETYGKNGKLINVPKLKSMRTPTLSFLKKTQIYETDEFGKLLNDPDMLWYGNFIRKYGIDELPQIYSIIKGDLSLVGIRPKEKSFWDSIPNSHREKIFKNKPGLLPAVYLIYDRFENLSSKDINKKILAFERLYSYKKTINPIQTDVLFGFKILGNIIFNGLRSS